MPSAAGVPILDGSWIFASYAATVVSSGLCQAVFSRRTTRRRAQRAAAGSARCWISSRTARPPAGTRKRARRARGGSRGSARRPARPRSYDGSAPGARGRWTAAGSRQPDDSCRVATEFGRWLCAASWLLVVVRQILTQRARAHIRGVYGFAAVEVPWPTPMTSGHVAATMDHAGGPEVQLVASRPPPRSRSSPRRRTDARRPTARVHRHLTGTRLSTDAGLRASPDVAIPVRA